MITIGILLLLIGIALRIQRVVREAVNWFRTRGRTYSILGVILVCTVVTHQSVIGVFGVCLVSIGLAIRFRVRLLGLARSFLHLLALALAVALSILQSFVRLRLHVVSAVLLLGLLLYTLYGLHGREFVSSLSAQPTTLRCGLAIIGFAVGFQVGIRMQHTERSSPVFFGLAGAVLGYMTAQFLLNLLFLVAGICLVAVLIWYWPTVHESIVTFAQQSGRMVPQRSESYVELIERLQTDHLSRVTAIERLAVPEEIRNGLLEEEELRFFRELESAGTGGDSTRVSNPQPGIGTWFDQPEGDTT